MKNTGQFLQNKIVDVIIQSINKKDLLFAFFKTSGTRNTGGSWFLYVLFPSIYVKSIMDPLLFPMPHKPRIYGSIDKLQHYWHHLSQKCLFASRLTSKMLCATFVFWRKFTYRKQGPRFWVYLYSAVVNSYKPS